MSTPDAQVGSAAMRQSKRIEDLREAIATVEQEHCRCKYLHTLRCIRCLHLEDLQAQLREAEVGR